MKTNAPAGKRYAHLSDEALIRLILSGEEEACTVLVRRYERLLRSILQRYLSDPGAVQEVMQDSFVRAFRGLRSFRGDSRFSTWLSRIAIWQACSRLRMKRFAPWNALDEVALHGLSVPHNQERMLEKEEASQLLRAAVGRLKPNDAMAIELYYFREQSIDEIRQITGWTEANVKSRLSRARQRLQGALRADGLSAEHFA